MWDGELLDSSRGLQNSHHQPVTQWTVSANIYSAACSEVFSSCLAKSFVRVLRKVSERFREWNRTVKVKYFSNYP